MLAAGKIPWWRAWQPAPVFLPGESHGQKSLVGYSPRGHRESDTTELMLGGIGGRKKRGRQRMRWLDGMVKLFNYPVAPFNFPLEPL